MRVNMDTNNGAKSLWQKLQSRTDREKRIFIAAILIILAAPFVYFIAADFKRNMASVSNSKFLDKLKPPPLDQSAKESLESMSEIKDQFEIAVKELNALEYEISSTSASDSAGFFKESIGSETTTNIE